MGNQYLNRAGRWGRAQAIASQKNLLAPGGIIGLRASDWTPQPGKQLTTRLTAENLPVSFSVFDALQYTNTPALGLEPFDIWFENEFWAGTPGEPDLDYIRDVFIPSHTPTDLACIDIELWKLSDFHVSPSERDANIAKYLVVLDDLRAGYPDIAFGFFSRSPAARRSIVKNLRLSLAGLLSWQAETLAISPLAEQQDILFPEFYAEDGWSECTWLKHTEQFFLMTQEYIGDKPVIPFLRPRFIGTNTLIPGPMFRTMLDFCRLHCDSVVIWSISTSGPWDENAEWWTATQSFIADNEL